MIEGKKVDAEVLGIGLCLNTPVATRRYDEKIGVGISVTRGDVPGYPGRTMMVCCACPDGGMMALLTVAEALAMAGALLNVAGQDGDAAAGATLQ